MLEIEYQDTKRMCTLTGIFLSTEQLENTKFNILTDIHSYEHFSRRETVDDLYVIELIDVPVLTNSERHAIDRISTSKTGNYTSKIDFKLHTDIDQNEKEIKKYLKYRKHLPLFVKAYFE